MTIHETYMRRCIELARMGAGNTAPNPMVGAVLVHNNRIIAEGYHRQLGAAHAEVNCIHSVNECDRNLIPQSVLYVSLEPCAHHGKTPPCTSLIIENNIREVVIGCGDPFEEVNGKGIEKLQQAGIKVVTGVLEDACRELNKRFFTFYTKQRPYIILKWAQSADKKTGSGNHERILISNEFSNRLAHRWRSEEAAILVGTNTALLDNPSLTTRLWPGKNPARLVVDMDLKLPSSVNIFNKEARTIVFNKLKQDETGPIQFFKVAGEESLIQQIINALYQMKIQSVIVEGGTTLLQSFIDEGIWDEARVIENAELILEKGIQAPVLRNEEMICSEDLLTDKITWFKNFSAQ